MSSESKGMDFVRVAEEEGEEPIELPTEDDHTLLISTLQAQFPGSCGLKYQNFDTKAVRGVRSNEGRLYPPLHDKGWGANVYFCVFPKENKRKCEDILENSTAKTKRMETRLRCTDLIVLGLPWKTTDASLREYFETFGEVIMIQVKKDIRSGQSKGFGFVRFAVYEVQARVLSSRHLIDGRWCEVKIPNSKAMLHQIPSKVFVGRCTEDISAEDLRAYFSKFGEVTDVFIPKPFRAFSFVTFLDQDVAQSLCGEDHIIKGISVYVSNATPKVETNRSIGRLNNQSTEHNLTYRFQNSGNGLHSSKGSYPRSNKGISDSGAGYGTGRHNSAGICHGGGNDNLPMHFLSEGAAVGRKGASYNYGSMSNQPLTENSNEGWVNHKNREQLDMPNLQALGINNQSHSSSNRCQSAKNSLGAALNLNSLPVNQAIAAALNHCLMGGNRLDNQNLEGQGTNFLSWVTNGICPPPPPNSHKANCGKTSQNNSKSSSTSSKECNFQSGVEQSDIIANEASHNTWNNQTEKVVPKA